MLRFYNVGSFPQIAAGRASRLRVCIPASAIVNNNEKTMELAHKGPFCADLARCPPPITME